MKSAEEWSKEWQEKEGFSGYEVLPDIEMIKAIIQDAYKSGWIAATRECVRLQQGIAPCQSNQPTKS